MSNIQTGILREETKLARYLSFNISDESVLIETLSDLLEVADGDAIIVGIGQSLVMALGKEVNGLRIMPARSAKAIDIPSTPAALWLWLRSDDRGELFHLSRLLEDLLAGAFELVEVVDSFQFDANRDLTGYEDGTENPKGDDAIAAAILQDHGEGMDGSSYVAVQQWVHDFNKFDDMPEDEQDNTFGRHISDNEEFDEAPESAHVKRTAQESFNPEAFILRRSMPWADAMNAGLIFVAFGKSFDAFEAILQRMLGYEDGIQDALFNFTNPVTGAYFWCPPMKDGKLDLTALGI